MYTYPTLLIRLVPLLARLFAIGRLRAVVSLTYHLSDDTVSLPTATESNKWTTILDRVDKEHDLCLYTNIFLQPTTISGLPVRENIC
jgi:hypothetical protein